MRFVTKFTTNLCEFKEKECVEAMKMRQNQTHIHITIIIFELEKLFTTRIRRQSIHKWHIVYVIYVYIHNLIAFMYHHQQHHCRSVSFLNLKFLFHHFVCMHLCIVSFCTTHIVLHSFGLLFFLLDLVFMVFKSTLYFQENDSSTFYAIEWRNTKHTFCTFYVV